MVVPRRVLLFAVLLSVPASARALDAHEVLRYDLFSGRPVGSAGEMRLAAAADGHVLLGWTAYRPAVQRESVRVQWLSPDGLPLGEPIVAVRRGYLRGLAARPGGGALILSGPMPPGTRDRLTFLNAGGVVARIDTADLGCQYPEAITATGSGYFLACYRWSPELSDLVAEGWWLDDDSTAIRGRVELGVISGLALAGGPRTGVALFYNDREGRSFVRWMTRWSRPEPVLVDGGSTLASHGSITRLGKRVFGIAWVHEHAVVDAGGEDQRRLTAVHVATFRAPDLVFAERRFSPLVGTAEESTGEQRRPMVFPTEAKEQVVGWFECSYHSSPAGLVCWEDDGLLLRERRVARPSGAILELADVFAGSRFGYTGERLVTSRLVYRAEDRWDLEVRVLALE